MINIEVKTHQIVGEDEWILENAFNKKLKIFGIQILNFNTLSTQNIDKLTKGKKEGNVGFKKSKIE